MKKQISLILLSLLIFAPAKALVYKYTATASNNKIRMEVEHSIKKEILFFDFNHAAKWQRELTEKQPAFADEFEQLVSQLSKYKNIGVRTYNNSLFRKDNDTLAIYNHLKAINSILEKIGYTIIVEEIHSTIKQAKNILSDPTIYLPQIVAGIVFANIIYRDNRRGGYFVFREQHLDIPTAFFAGTGIGFLYPILDIISVCIAEARHG